MLSVFLLSTLFYTNILGDYTFFRDAKTYKKGQSFCQSVGGDLAPIISEEDRDIVTNMIDDYVESVWIGLYSAHKIGWFIFEDDTVECPNKFSGACVDFWRIGHPRCIEKKSGYKCASFYPSDDVIDNNVDCNTKKPFLCINAQKSPSRETTTHPTKYPTKYPTQDPTQDPTHDPSKVPSKVPSKASEDTTVDPTFVTTVPTSPPTLYPTSQPTLYPTADPTTDPTKDPTTDPTSDPTSDPTEYCEDRECCHPLQGAVPPIPDEECEDLHVEECMSDEMRDRCDWNCDEREKPWWRREDGIVRDGRGYTRKYLFRQDWIPNWKEPEDSDAESTRPNTAQELQQFLTIDEIDECRDVFENTMDYSTAADEFSRFNQGEFEEIIYPDGEIILARRRMSVFGVDQQQEVKPEQQQQYPQNKIGLVSFKTNTKTKECTGNQITKRYVLTAAHCCHIGGTGDKKGWYSEWKWYPGVLKRSEIDNKMKINIVQAATFSPYTREDDVNYDICMLKLKDDKIDEWFGCASDPQIKTETQFSFYGYPGYKEAISNTKLKWGHAACTPAWIKDDRLGYTCDTGKGQSGAGLYKSDYMINCVHSHGSTTHDPDHNKCARITGTKARLMKDYMVAAIE